MALLSNLFLAATVVFILGGTAYSFLKHGIKKQRTPSRKALYDDDDGQATELSQSKYHERPQKLATLVLVLAGLSVAFASAVRATKASNGDEDESFVVLSCWVRVASWVGHESRDHSRDTMESFDLLILYQQLKDSQNFSPRSWIITGSEIGAQIMIGFFAVGASLSVPRRPAVFFNEQHVDAYLTVSALQRFTFSWAWPIFRRARSHLQFEVEDLPLVGYVTRAKTLQNRFYLFQKSGHERLWKVIYRLHRQAFAQVAILTVLQSIFAYAPHLCLYRILGLLELQQERGTPSLNLWFWAIALGCAVFTQHVLEVRYVKLCRRPCRD
ncbi:MAG: hypothetical protein Q9167_004686 [Letrouitia subvulpina]